tara:strand:- start:658 stop:915 length:258 start_codon:yes stop_codon:yes gene_type:complete
MNSNIQHLKTTALFETQINRRSQLDTKIIEKTEKSYRYRINISRSVKGVFTFDCTVEGTDAPMDEVLQKSDELRQELVSRYPTDL